MKAIQNVKLGINPKDMSVIVSADIEMNGKEDKDDLYLVMFNIMDDPLRLSLFTIGGLFDLVKKNTNMGEGQIIEIMSNSPEKYIQLALQNTEELGNRGQENIKIVLDTEKNATKARMVLTSMIEKKLYRQKSKYNIEGEIIEKEQNVDTEPLIPQLKMMLEIVKRWESFDAEQFQQDLESGKIKV